MINTNIMATNTPYANANEYDYPPHQLVAATHQTNMPPAMGGMPSTRPTLDVYYHHQPQHPHMHSQQQGYNPAMPMPSPHHHHAAMAHTPHAYYVAPPQQPQHYHYVQHYTSTPSALASSSSLKRKMSSGSNVTTPAMASSSSARSSPSTGMLSHDKLCDLCHHPDPILFSASCGHLFHSRCVNVWPLAHCPVCRVDLPQVSILRINMNEEIETRSGKWTRAEEKFIEIIIQEFDRFCFPLANGTPVRLVLAKLLNCSTMRLSKKFQKNALGKRTFRIPKPSKGVVAMEFNSDEHTMREKEFSRLETIFRHELVEQFRRENNTDDGAYVETINLRKAVKQFWVTNFLKFAVVVGQAVEGLDVSDGKKKKQALQMLRDGQYDDLLSSALASSPSSTATRAPSVPTPPARPTMYATQQPGGGGGGPSHYQQQQQPQHPHQVATWSTGYGPPPPSLSANNQVDLDLHHQHAPPQKKQRTPEIVVRQQLSCEVPTSSSSSSSHFDLHVQPQQQSMTSFDYGRLVPHAGGYGGPPAPLPAAPSPYAAGSVYPLDPYTNYSSASSMAPKSVRSPEGNYDGHGNPHSPSSHQPYPEPSPTHGATDRQQQSGVQGSAASYRPSATTTNSATTTTTTMLNDSSAYSGMASGDSGVPNVLDETNSSSSGGNNQAPCPWDGLLEDISNEPTGHVDPSLQAWSNLSMM